jgi:GH18 family chitinase
VALIYRRKTFTRLKINVVSGVLESMEAVRKLGIGLVIEIGSWGDAQFFADISADKNKRTQFITFVLEVAQNYSAAGISIKWTSPSCKQVGDTFSLFYLDNLSFIAE